MNAIIGQLAYVGDVWYEVLEKRKGVQGNEYNLYSIDFWIPEKWIKEVESKRELGD